MTNNETFMWLNNLEFINIPSFFLSIVILFFNETTLIDSCVDVLSPYKNCNTRILENQLKKSRITFKIPTFRNAFLTKYRISNIFILEYLKAGDLPLCFMVNPQL